MIYPKQFLKRIFQLKNKAANPAQRLSDQPSPWLDMDPEKVPQTPGMTTLDELQFLNWICSTAFTGKGLAVELGSFMGRTTMAMASGLSASGKSNAKLVSMDTHIWDQWTLENYCELIFSKLTSEQIAQLPEDVAKPQPGSSFRPLYDLFTDPYHSNIEAISADLDKFQWRGDPIEILFVDAAKSWPTLDKIVTEFFPALMDGAIVIHQDYNHFFSWWLHPVTERMIEDGLLEPAENVKATPSQAFRYHRKGKFNSQRYLQSAFSSAEIKDFLQRSQGRYDGADFIAVAGARFQYLISIGDLENAISVYNEVHNLEHIPENYAYFDLLNLRKALKD